MSAQKRVALRPVWFALLLAVAWLGLVAADAKALGIRQFSCAVPMRDGACLNADVYLPRFPAGCWPAILVRTPDGRHLVTKLQARYVCNKGYALVVQDIRQSCQRPGAEGILFLSDGWGELRDGHDTIRWLAAQPWCNGRVATWGPSSMGYTQNLLAPDAPEALCAQHVMMAFSNMYTQVAYQGGALRKELVEGWLEGRPCASKMLETILAHPAYDDLWARLAPEAQASRVNTPAVFWGGWYDAFLQGTIRSFVTIQSQGGPRARGHCRLILGPWTHQDLKWLVDPRKARGVPQAAKPERFFDYWLKGVCNGVQHDRPVHYYVMGDAEDPCTPGNVWRCADHWPPPSVPTAFYLHRDGALRRVPPASAKASLSYRYDPENPVPTLGGNNLNLPPGPRDQRPVESRSDVLVFTSDALVEPLEVTGQVLAKLSISSDCPDTDFTVKLTDVYPDGRSCLVADGILRARFRESLERPLPLEPGKIYRVTVDLWSTSYVFNRGHRIRVAVSSSNAPRFAPNPNTGLAPGAAPPRIATNTVYVSNEHPSCVVLPVYTPPDP